jgi:uncharacterized protein YybS (DUF2232 family)
MIPVIAIMARARHLVIMKTTCILVTAFILTQLITVVRAGKPRHSERITPTHH